MYELGGRQYLLVRRRRRVAPETGRPRRRDRRGSSRLRCRSRESSAFRRKEIQRSNAMSKQHPETRRDFIRRSASVWRPRPARCGAPARPRGSHDLCEGPRHRRQRSHQRRLRRLRRPHEHAHPPRHGAQQGARRRAGGGRQRHLGQAQGARARGDRRRRASRSITTTASVCARPDIDVVVIASPDHWHHPHAMEALRNRQGRLPREADDLHGRRGEGDRRRGQGQRPRAAGRQPVHLDGSLPQGAEGRSPTG